jgi:hypothetical protein
MCNLVISHRTAMAALHTRVGGSIVVGRKRLQELKLLYAPNQKNPCHTLVNLLEAELCAMARKSDPGLKVRNIALVPQSYFPGGADYKFVRHKFSTEPTVVKLKGDDMDSLIPKHNEVTKATADGNKDATLKTVDHGLIELDVLEALFSSSTTPLYNVAWDPRQSNTILNVLLQSLMRVDFLRPSYTSSRCIVELLHLFRDTLRSVLMPAVRSKVDLFWHPKALPDLALLADDEDKVSQGQLDAVASHDSRREHVDGVLKRMINDGMRVVAVGPERRVAKSVWDAIMSTVNVSDIHC